MSASFGAQLPDHSPDLLLEFKWRVPSGIVTGKLRDLRAE